MDSGASFTGGTGSDTFNATHLTFGASDVLVGGAGVDTLTIVDTGTAAFTLPVATVSGIENINIRNLNGSGAVAAVTEVAQTTFSNVGVGATVVLAGRIITATAGTATAADIAAAFITGTTTGNAAVSGTLAGYTITAGSSLTGASFSSTTAGNVSDLINTGTSATGINQRTTATIVAGTDANVLVAGGTYTVVVNGVTLTTAGIAGADAAALLLSSSTVISNSINAFIGSTVATPALGVVTISSPSVISVGTPVHSTAANATTTMALAQALIPASPPTISITQGVAAVTSSGLTDTVDATKFTDATAFTSDASTGLVNITGLTAAQTAVKKAGAGAFGPGFGSTVTAGTIEINGGSTAGAVDITGAALAAQTINSTGAANTIGALTGAATATATTINATTNLTTGAATNLGATVTVNGAGNVSFGTTALQAGVTTLNASGMTGNLTAVLSNLTTAKVTGGAGNDVITLGAAMVAGGMVDAGAGSADRLVVTTDGFITTATAPFIKNFEVVQANTGVTVDVSQLAAFNTITGIRINDSASSTVAVNGLNAVQAANVAIIAALNATGAITLGLTGATTGGQIDTVNATLTTTTAATAAAAAAAQNSNLTAMTLTGVEKLTLTGNNTSPTTTGAVTFETTNATSLDSITLTNAGTNSIVIAAGQTASNLNVDASASLGSTTIDAALYNVSTGASLRGGSNHDIIIGSARGDNIIGNAGNDVLGGTALTGATVGTDAAVGTAGTAVAASTNADTFTGGAGLDVFAIGVGAATTMSTITDLNLGGANSATGVDRIVTDSTAATVTVVTFTAAQQATISAASTFAAALDAAIAAFGANAAQAATFTYGADTYFVLNDIAATTTFTATDLVVKITGVVGTLDASDITLL